MMGILTIIETLGGKNGATVSSDQLLSSLGKKPTSEDYMEVICEIVKFAKKYKLQLRVILTEPTYFWKKAQEDYEYYDEVVEITGVPTSEVYSYYSEAAGDTYVNFDLKLSDDETVIVPVSQSPENYIRCLIIQGNPWKKLKAK